MSRPLQLNTQMGQSHNQRYSFIETPLEMQSSVQQDIISRPAASNESPAPQHPALEHPSQWHEQRSHDLGLAHQSIAPQDASFEQRAPLEGQPTQYIPSEKERELQAEGIIPTYSKYPPPEQHPANFAPFADAPTRQPTVQSPSYSYIQPPNSPGPLPAKMTINVPARSDTLSVAPDANPLSSPKSPQFPPTTTAATPHAPLVEDLRTYHQPGQIMHPNQEVRGGHWSHGLCECSSIGTCCLGLACPCILFGRTQHRLGMRSKKQDPTNMLGHDTCNGSCTAFALLCGFQWLWATIQHTRTRKAYGIEGDIASDCVRATCCTCCTLIQDEKEIQKREEQRSRAALERGATLLSPYTAPGPLAYPPPPK
ncbi:hypothetical protein N7492_010516 [Penicillium capsulatum]|uniref:DUF614 domain protein n=1 Tax=Penicillium capsulatum TaxID=69766 RepID=A0A9W9HPU7_9EURO|nr:hypothetical protein N7492_010516 [Penicillium capsulatum]KAJ6113018.1 hypothetical protein N7512_008342 [Penicillium capsulatum]